MSAEIASRLSVHREFTQHLIDAGIDASIGTVGDALDNALAESTIGLYKTELIKPQGPWHNLSEVDVATAAWVEAYSRPGEVVSGPGVSQ